MNEHDEDNRVLSTASKVTSNAASDTASDESSENQVGYVVVEGPIGVGKTSLARRIAHSFGTPILLEKPDRNPFLQRFYQNPKQYALSTQLHFLFQRMSDVGELAAQSPHGVSCVSDFLIDKDPLFAKMNLDRDEYNLYRRVYDSVVVDVPRPTLVIYLQAPVNVLEDRIRRRGVKYEQVMSEGYLDRVNETYNRHFLHYTDAPLLVINAESINFVDNDDDYKQLLDHATTIRSGRHYFNPLPSANINGV